MAIYSAVKTNKKTGVTTKQTVKKPAVSAPKVSSPSPKAPPAAAPKNDVSISPVNRATLPTKKAVTTPVATAPTPAPKPIVNTRTAPRPAPAPTANVVTPAPAAPTANRRAPVTRNLALEQSALADSLKSFSEGGANVGVPNGTDVPGALDADPGFRKLLQEQIYSRAYGTGRPEFAPEAQPGVVPQAAPAPAMAPEVVNPLAGFGTENFDINSLLRGFGVNAPGSTLPAGTGTETDLASPYDQELADLSANAFDTQAADDAYASTLEAIRQKFDQERVAARQAVDNSIGERYGNLAGAGFNPLASGGGALESEKQNLTQRFMSDIAQRQAAEEANAAQVRSAARDAAVSGRMKFLQDERANRTERSNTTYQRGRNSVQDSISVLNAVLNAVEKNRSISNTERDNTVNSFKTLLDTLGSTAFDGLGDADLRAFEQALNVPAGSMRGALASFRAAEIQAAKDKNKPELREVNGSLYQMVFDPGTQRWVPSVLIQKAAPASGGGGGGSRRTVSVNGGAVEADVYDQALAAWRKAQADSTAGVLNLTAAEKNDIVDAFIFDGGNATYNPFLENRRVAEEEFGSGAQGNDTQAQIDAILKAFE